MAASSSGEAAKLQQHLDLLRQQYVKLQQRHAELEQKYTRAVATSGSVGEDHFISRLLRLVSDLYDKPLYSDLTVVLADRRMAAHRFVLASRSRHWNPKDENLAMTTEIDLSHMTSFVASSMIRWTYTDSVILPTDQAATIEMLAAANKYHLLPLKEKCEQALISTVSVRNCIKLYQTSEEHRAEELKKYCLQIISSHWNNLNTSDFAELSAPLLYDMFKAHTSFPLHLAIQHLREDVVFLYLIENNAQLPQKLDECDSEGNIPLNLALLYRHEGIANTLVSHRCDLDSVDSDGNSLLHLAILRGDAFSASFLVKNGANTIQARRSTQETPLHLVAAYNPSQALTNVSSVAVREAPWPSENMAQIASLLLEYHANPDSQDDGGYTPLHRAIACGNVEVIDILLNNHILNLDLRNKNGETALWLALKQLDPAYLASGNISEYDNTFAARLIKRGANLDAVDTRTGNSLLHQATMEPNESAAVFLVQHGALPNQRNAQGEAPIHIAAMNDLHQLVQVLLRHGADPNLQTTMKLRPPTPLVSAPHVEVGQGDGTHVRAIRSDSATIALSALTVTSQATSLTGSYSFDQPLPRRPAVSSSYTPGGGRYLPPSQPHLPGGQVRREGSPSGGRRSASPAGRYAGTNPFGSESEEEEEHVGVGGVSGYHVAPLQSLSSSYQPPRPGDGMRGGGSRGSSQQSNPVMARSQGGVRSPVRPPPVSQEPRPPSTSPSPSTMKEFIDPPVEFDVSQDPGGRTALHLAIAHRHPRVVDVLLQHKGTISSGKLEIDLDVNLRDGHDETPLGLSLWTDQFDVAGKLLKNGADIEYTDSEEMGMLYVAIVREKPKSCLFLLDHGANFKKRTPQDETLLVLAIRHQLEQVADRLCEMGVDLSVADQHGNSPLWVALRSRQESIASKLIIHGCDPNAWHRCPDGSTLALLHRAILLNDTPTACFLIKSGADVNSPSRPSSAGGESSPPLHMACERGMKEVVQCLVDRHADVNTKDSKGRSALHVSISMKQPRCSDILLGHPDIDLTIRDKHNSTPFATALAVKDNETGLAILQREPKAAEQVDARGQNFIHQSVLAQDVEAVLFLLSVRVDVNSKVQNPTLSTPLHFAVKGGSELLVRNLLLAGARVSDVDNHQRGVLHMAVEGNFPTLLSVLLENNADPDLMGEDGNSALHLSMLLGHIACVKVLLEESDINMGAVNMKGQNCLHVLSKHAKDNAAAIFNLLIESAPSFPINKQDMDGNTPLLLAYLGGSTVLCNALIQRGAHPGMCNRQGTSIFNAPVATKQLLFNILDQIRLEPSWLEGNLCQNCGTKFNISHRKHHCRHCGRLLCKPCTSHQMPILKFDLTKPVRLCEVCADSFHLSASG